MITSSITTALTRSITRAITDAFVGGGSPAFDPAYLITEDDFNITTEAGDQLTTEG